jgi:hypothetical protein
MANFKSSIRQRKYDYLIKQGFFHREAVELSRTSRTGMSAPYFRRLVRSRRRTVDNLSDSGYTEEEIKSFVREQYIKNGWIKKDSKGRVLIDIWQFLRDQEDKSKTRGEEYESPWRNKTHRKKSVKKIAKRVTRRAMLESMVTKLKNRIARTGNTQKRLMYEEQLYGYEKDLRKIEDK